MVEMAGLVSLVCPGHTGFIVLEPCFGEGPFNRFFFHPICRYAACWPWHGYPLSLFNRGVIDSPRVVFAAGPPPSAAQNAAREHNAQASEAGNVWFWLRCHFRSPRSIVKTGCCVSVCFDLLANELRSVTHCPPNGF